MFYGGKQCNGWHRFRFDVPGSIWNGQRISSVRGGPGFRNALTLAEAWRGQTEPTVPLVEPPVVSQQNGDGPQCSICMDSSPGADVTLACGHTFHTECISTWAEAGASTCPDCRKAFVEIGGVAVVPRVQVDHTDYGAPEWDNMDFSDDEGDSDYAESDYEEDDNLDDDPDWKPDADVDLEERHSHAGTKQAQLSQ